MTGVKYIMWVTGLLCAVMPMSAGAQTVADARKLVAEKEYKKAINIYSELYGISPDSVYSEYLNTLIAAKKCKGAEKLVEDKAAKFPPGVRKPEINLELGMVYDQCGNADKAKAQYDSVLGMLNGDDIFTNNVANAFVDAGKDDYAILAYERALQLLGNPPLYNRQLATLHAKMGNLDKAVDALLQGGPSGLMPADAAKELLLELLGNDENKLRTVQKALVRKINLEPGNNYYGEILTWIYTQRNDWDGALMQIEAIDERNNEPGRRVFEFARTAVAAKEYETANKAFDHVIEKGKDMPYYVMAKSEKLAAAFARLEGDHARKPEDVTALAALYDSFLVEFPKHYTQKTASDFATLNAVYGNNVKRAIQILTKAIEEPDTRRNMKGIFKLQLGDYYLLQGRQWDATLSYSQVEKEFKQDVMGEDARFRNARLAYYFGDFDLAQKLLSILKSGTSNLIANDAIDLSVVLTENIEDSVTTPLERFAYAGLLLFQNKDKEAEALVDSIGTAFPEHPLNDDLMMMRAAIAMKHHDYPKAIAHLKVVIDKYGKDVLGDDAVFKTAEIYYHELHQQAEAKNYYEQLIIDYPGSTYVQAARQKLAEINGQATQ